MFLGGVKGVDTVEIWKALVEFFRSLPSYRESYPEDAQPVKGIRCGSGAFAFAEMADAVLASTAVAVGTIWIDSKKVDIKRPGSFRPPADGPAPPLPIDRMVHPIQRGAEGPGGGGAATAPKHPPPPPVPAPPPEPAATLWVGNLPPPGGDAAGLEPAGDPRELLDAHLTRLAVESPGYDVESGPPLRRVRLHRSGLYAFVELRDMELGEHLRAVFDGADYHGRQLHVTWALSPQHRQAAATASAAARAGAAAGAAAAGALSPCLLPRAPPRPPGERASPQGQVHVVSLAEDIDSEEL